MASIYRTFGAGNDTISLANPGVDSLFIDGGAGVDRLIINFGLGDVGTGMTFGATTFGTGVARRSTLGTNPRSLDYTSFQNVENFSISGTSKDDSVVVSFGSNVIRTGAGNDRVTINAGSYASNSYRGHVDGGFGFDFLTVDLSSTTNNLYYPSLQYMTASSRWFSAVNFEQFDIKTGSGNDTLIQSGIINGVVLRANDVISTGAGNDIINAGLGNDAVYGGDGIDRLIVDYSVGDTGTGLTFNGGNQFGSAFRNVRSTSSTRLDNIFFDRVEEFTVTGTSKNDTITTGAGNDIINGGAGNDTIRTGAGNDSLIGGAGNDMLVGGAGNDVLTGGGGNDFFLYDTNAAFSSSSVGRDRITDFLKGSDKIVLDKSTFTALQSLAATGFSIASEFAVVSSDAAAQASIAKIVYSRGSGSLFYNQNGASAGFGTGAQFATFASNPLLAASDFIIQA